LAFINIEIKARTTKVDFIRQYLFDNGADFKGIDNQTDTYFNVPNGRLKLRQGNIENTLIQYFRPDEHGPKQSDFQLIEVTDGETLKKILTASLGIKVVVEKRREIFYFNNVKFHLDALRELGNFVEIEASNKTHPLSLDMLRGQCVFYKNAFQISEEDLINISYSDILLSNPYGRI
jgi:adenylate cyclase, class 2